MHIDPVEDLASPANADERRVEELARQLHSIAADLCDTVTPYWRGLSLLERRYLRDRARAMLKQSII
jgi:hypothetical protein